MGYRDSALQVLQGAREELRKLLAEAVHAEAFADVSAIAGAAEGLAAITGNLLEPHGSTPQPSTSGGTSGARRATPVLALARNGASETSPSRTNAKQQFPQYFRADDRLVKRAWSKKDRQPYEHKAPREVVSVLVEAIRKRKGDQRPFEAGDILPLYSKAGDEYPSYQSYLALGWLRHAGAIAKGRDGYLLKRGWDDSRIAQLWETLPSVA